MSYTEEDSLGNWRNFFRTPDHDIFDIINKAIIVAASDFPLEFKSKRGLFTEMLYASNSCEKVPTNPPKQVTGLNDTHGASCIDEIDDDKTKYAAAIIPESVKASSSKQSVVEDEEGGLECPPLKEGVFLDTPIHSKKGGKNLDYLRKLYLEEKENPKGHKKQPGTSNIKKLPAPHHHGKGKRLDYIYETSIEKKLDSPKRKLRERYEEVQKAKRQKTIKLMEFKDLPRQKPQHQRPGHRQSLMNRISKARTAIRN